MELANPHSSPEESGAQDDSRDDSLEHSLDQIERLAAELQHIAGVISPVDPELPEASEPTRLAGPGTPPVESAEPPAITSPRPAPRRDRPPRFTWSGPQTEPLAGAPAEAAEKESEPRQPSPTRVSPPPATPSPLAATQVLPSLPRISANPDPRDVGAPAEPLPLSEQKRITPSKHAVTHGRRTRRGLVLAVLAAILAIPAFAVGAIQPWLDSEPDEDQLHIASGERGDNAAEFGPPPNPAVPNGDQGDEGEPANPNPMPRADQPPKRQRKYSSRTSDPARPSPSTSLRRGPVDGLSMRVNASNVMPYVGESVRFTVQWRDGEGRLAGITQQWGDGTPNGGSVQIKPCTEDGINTSGSQEFTHAFAKPGSYPVRLAVTTYTCNGQKETQTVPMTIEVRPAASSSPPASPSPTPSPS